MLLLWELARSLEKDDHDKEYLRLQAELKRVVLQATAAIALHQGRLEQKRQGKSQGVVGLEVAWLDVLSAASPAKGPAILRRIEPFGPQAGRLWHRWLRQRARRASARRARSSRPRRRRQ